MPRSLRRFKDLEYAVGTDGTLSIALKDSDGSDLSVTGASASWRLYESVPRRRRKPFRGQAKATKTSAAGEISLAAGLATVTIADTDLDRMSGRHFHTLEITDSSGNVTHLGQGDIMLRAKAA